MGMGLISSTEPVGHADQEAVVAVKRALRVSGREPLADSVVRSLGWCLSRPSSAISPEVGRRRNASVAAQRLEYAAMAGLAADLVGRHGLESHHVEALRRPL